jgi:hypothetical protein
MTKIKIQIKNRYDGSILFEHECENNTIKETLMQGVKPGSDLRGCDLRGCDLRGCAIPIFSKWPVVIIDNKIIKIGCKEKIIEDWDLFFASTAEFDTKRGTAEFKQIEAMYLAYKAYLTHLNT